MVDRRHFLTCRQFNELVAPVEKERIRADNERPRALLDQRDKGCLQLAVGVGLHDQ